MVQAVFQLTHRVCTDSGGEYNPWMQSEVMHMRLEGPIFETQDRTATGGILIAC